jgi:hypothetical protein
MSYFGVALALTTALSAQQHPALPKKAGSVRFAVIGDSGTGGGAQQRVARRLAAEHEGFDFEFVLMLGDNLYGNERPHDYAAKFERPYKPLLDAGVKFYASLGNHDEPSQRFYKLFNMNGERYYTFKAPRGSVRFFALDSNYLSKEQLDWLAKELPASNSDWKIAFFHHPLYSSGEKHGSDDALRDQLEPLFVQHGVNLVLTGHEHFYERLKPQQGITYIISGSAAKLRRGNIGETDLTAKGYDQDYTFLLVEISGDELYFRALTDDGRPVDSGVIRRATDASSVTRMWEKPHAARTDRKNSAVNGSRRPVRTRPQTSSSENGGATATVCRGSHRTRRLPLEQEVGDRSRTMSFPAIDRVPLSTTRVAVAESAQKLPFQPLCRSHHNTFVPLHQRSRRVGRSSSSPRRNIVVRTCMNRP